jgi:hypothetical protein
MWHFVIHMCGATSRQLMSGWVAPTPHRVYPTPLSDNRMFVIIIGGFNGRIPFI